MSSWLDDFRAFDPNTTNTLPWATYVVHRRPKFKTHGTRALALNAMSHNNLCKMYRFDNGQWILAAAKDSLAENCKCTVCGGSTVIPAKVPGAPFVYRNSQRVLPDGSLDVGQYLWKRNRRKIIDPPELLYCCEHCAKRFG